MLKTELAAPGVPDMPNPSPRRQQYCNEACRTAGRQIICRKCKAPATLVGDWRHCGVCERRPHKPVKEESDLHKMLTQNIKALTIANNVWGYDLVPQEGGGEAKRRKRA